MQETKNGADEVIPFDTLRQLKEEFPESFSSADEREISQLVRAVKLGKERKWQSPVKGERVGSEGLTPDDYSGIQELQPLPGIEHTFVRVFKNNVTSQYGIYGPGMYPGMALLVPETRKPVDRIGKRYEKLKTAVDAYQASKAKDKEMRQKSERARLVLEALGVWGQSISASKSGDELTATGEPRKNYESAILSIIQFGLWSRHENNALHIGDFAKSGVMTVTAGDHWEGFAAVFPPNPATVSVTVAGKPRKFIPPTEMVYVVPTEDCKDALVDALYEAGIDGSKLGLDTFIDELIFTHDEVLQGKLTNYFEAHFTQKDEQKE